MLNVSLAFALAKQQCWRLALTFPVSMFRTPVDLAAFKEKIPLGITKGENLGGIHVRLYVCYESRIFKDLK